MGIAACDPRAGGPRHRWQTTNVFPCWVIAVGAKVISASCSMALLLRLLVALPLALLVSACMYTEVPFGPDDNAGVVARSMEEGGTFYDRTWFVTAAPRGWTYPMCDLLILPNPPSPRFVAKRGFVGIVNALSTLTPLLFNKTGLGDQFTDGMNEDGLTASANVFSAARFGEPRACGTSSDGTTVIDFGAFLPWALSQYATVAELVAALPQVRVVESGSADLRAGLAHFKVHWAVRDRSGASVVIEALDGTGVMHVWNNTVGVLTNDPQFDWHLNNTAQYAPISNGFVRVVPPPKNAAGPFVPQPRGHGYNLIGLPGDLSSASQFVRAFVAKHLAVTNTRPKTEMEALTLGTHLLNAVDIPDGVVSKNAELEPMFRTAWAVLKSPATGLYMWRSYSNSRWQSINLSDLDAFFRTSSAPRNIQLFMPGFGELDVTANLLQSEA